MADKLPQSVEELLAAHKAVVDAMSPKQRTAAQPRVGADTSTAGLSPYEQMEARAEQTEAREQNLMVLLDITATLREQAEVERDAALVERDQWRGTAMNKIEMVNSTALRAKDAEIARLTARVAELTMALSQMVEAFAALMGAVKPLDWESIKTAPRNGEWFFAKTARGTIRFVHFGDIYDRFPISHDHTEIWETEPVEWISPSRVLSALSILTARVAELEQERAKDHAEINIKADAIERMINQSAGDYANISTLQAKVTELCDTLKTISH